MHEDQNLQSCVLILAGGLPLLLVEETSGGWLVGHEEACLVRLLDRERESRLVRLLDRERESLLNR